MAKRKSIIKRSVARKICTAKFELVDIVSEVEEEIEWDNEKERKIESDKVGKHLLLDFVETYNQAMKELGVDRCIAQVTTLPENIPNNKEKEEKEEDPLAFLE
jgi:hypothetical protein